MVARLGNVIFRIGESYRASTQRVTAH
jgi:hypothetical protein